MGGRTSWQILLVREHEQETILHFPVTQYAVQLLLRLVDTVPVLAVDDEDQTLRASVVMPPEGSNLVLSSNIPDVELGVLVCDCLHVEADGRDGGDVLVKLEFVENG